MDQQQSYGNIRQEAASIQFLPQLHFWPLALRLAAEAGYRSQMARFGIPLPRLIRFGTQAGQFQKMASR